MIVTSSGERPHGQGLRGDGPGGARRRRYARASAPRATWPAPGCCSTRSRPIAKLVGRAPRPALSTAELPSPLPPPRLDTSPSWPLVVLGSSTGGPNALAEILAAMPDTRDSCTVIVQHVDVTFAPGLARWLSERTGRKVQLVEPGDKPLPGQTWLAATNDHVILDESLRFRYVAEPLEVHYRPSVDVFFQSVAGRLARAGRRGPADRHGPRRRRRPAGAPPEPAGSPSPRTKPAA